MADNRTAQLLSASFKGVTFSVFAENVPEAGRKLILHEYVNSSERFIEDQGQIPPSFSIRAFVHGADFIQRAARLEQVLNESGPGRLSLPVFGVLDAYAGAYSKDANQQSVGEISYTIPFFAGRAAPGPSVARVGIQDVYQAGDEARKAVEDEFTLSYSIPSTATNAIAAIGDLNNAIENIQNTIDTVLPIDDLQSVLRTAKTIKLNAAKYVRDPALLAKNLLAGIPQAAGIWQQISLGMSKAQSLGRGIDELILLTNSGGGLSLSINDINRAVSVSPSASSIPLWPATTSERVQRNKARLTLAQSNRVASLIGLYEVAAARTYTTDTEIDDVRRSLEDVHERIMRTETFNYSLVQSKPNVRNSVEKVRLASLNVITQKEQEAYQITTDNAGSPTSALVRSYALYAEEFTNASQIAARAVQIGSLNSELSSSGLVNDFKVFQV